MAEAMNPLTIQKWMIALALLTGLFFPSSGRSGSDTILSVGHFSVAQEGDKPPEGWKPLTFPKIPMHTQYTVVKEGETRLVIFHPLPSREREQLGGYTIAVPG